MDKMIDGKGQVKIRFSCRGRYRNSKTFGFGILIEFGAWRHLNVFLGPDARAKRCTYHICVQYSVCFKSNSNSLSSSRLQMLRLNRLMK